MRPQELQLAAMKPDFSLFPAKRAIPLVTPMQEDYLEKKQSSVEQGQLTGKRR